MSTGRKDIRFLLSYSTACGAYSTDAGSASSLQTSEMVR
jgi:hypothetical protein